MSDCKRNARRITAMEASSTAIMSKKRRIGVGSFELQLHSSHIELGNQYLLQNWQENTISLLQSKGFETAESTYSNTKLFRERYRLNEFSGDSDDMEFQAKSEMAVVSHQRIAPAMKMPPKAEIEEFFSTAEKYEQKRFADKYNYDIVKDLPLEGRYHWVRLN
ncbi:Cyclin-dependent kinase inhibitor [Quillaja saponaria]|uniref:Cyclin-dependent kinase inhibitor n=1 Tax=Quillaja saponaria TaxID=32244 RepID=A0AAD7LZY0_QUISA|nr:Cyclin-dependent kinase inhibitor [Quillaja saponaria]